MGSVICKNVWGKWRIFTVLAIQIQIWKVFIENKVNSIEKNDWRELRLDIRTKRSKWNAIANSTVEMEWRVSFIYTKFGICLCFV